MNIERMDKNMSGIKNVTFEELQNMQFDVVEHFGMVKMERSFKFFVMETVPPTEYGADCKEHTWHQVLVKTDEDMKKVRNYISDLFQVTIPKLNRKNCIQVIRELDNRCKDVADEVDFGACHVTFMNINPLFMKEGVPA